MEPTKQQILQRLTALCARGEHCQYEMLEKMRRMSADEQLQAEVMAYLVKEKYVDDARYARCFISDKVRNNKWGRRKVEQALRMKRIDEKIFTPLLDEIDEGDDYAETLRPLLRNKIKSVKGRNGYEIRMKLIRFALSRGFLMDTINQVLNEIVDEFLSDNDCDDSDYPVDADSDAHLSYMED